MKVALVIGLATGAINGLVALGIVLVYKGARVFNFAQAEFGTVAAFAAWGALTKAHLPYGLAIVVGLIAAVAMGMAVERAIVRPLRARPPVTTLVATAGVALLCVGLELALGGARLRVFPPAPVTLNVSVMGVMLSTQRIIALLVVISLGLALAWFFSRTSLGLAVLATSQEAIAARLAGISINHVSTFIWGSAALLGGIAGLLLAPINPFSPGFM
ncbi:MAG: branched-chain amino acid ABC transporter permease, partial [Actinomycetota bacterium]